MNMFVFNIITFLICFGLFSSVLLIFYYKQKKIDLLDMYIFVVILVLVLPYACIVFKNHPHYSVALSLTVFELVFFPLATVWLCVNLIFKRYSLNRFQRYLTFEYFSGQLKGINSRPFLILFLLLLLFKFYAIFRYGLLFSYDKTTLNLYGYSAPYWFTSLSAIYLPCLFTISLLWMVKALSSKGKVKIFYYILLSFSLMLSVFYRREGVFNVGFMVIIFTYIKYAHYFFRKKIIFCFLVGIFLLYYFVNMFEVGRYYFDHPEKSVNYSFIVKHSFNNPLLTWRSIKYRKGIMWIFNYKILHAQKAKKMPVKKGRLLYYSFLNSIPKIIWKNKKIVDVNNRLCKSYRMPAGEGFDWNIYGFLLADFGYYSVPIIGIGLLLFLIGIAYILKFVEKYPVLFVFYLGFFMDYLVWVISRPYGEIFLLFRNLILVTLVYLLYYGVKESFLYYKGKK